MALAVGLALQVPAAHADALTDKARALIESGNGVEAFRLLDPSEAERAGETEFDFLLGLAAMAAGQNTRAVFALERVLALDPNNVRARAEIARAYMALGETKTASQELETVKRQGVPADVSMTVDRYIASLRSLEDQGRTSLTGYLEATVGYDTNVNAGPNRNSIAIPSFNNQPLELDGDSKANKDGFGALGAGINLRTQIGNGYSLLAGAAGSYRGNFAKQQFDTRNADVNLGVTRTVDKDVFTLMAQAGGVVVDDDRYRNQLGLTGQWQRNLDARNQVGAFVQYADLRYPEMESRNAKRWVGGVTFAHLYRDGVMAYASAYGVGERPQHGQVDWLGFDGIGVRVGGRMNIDSQTVLFGGATYEHRRYNDDEPLFRSKRRDHQFGLTVGATHFFAREWSVTPQLSLTHNESKHDLNQYHRELVSVTIRRDF